MALSERTRPYETLIRHKDDGTIGAHHVQITEILRDKTIISATIGEAMPLAVAEGQNGLKLADVIGQAAAAALTQVETLQGQVATLTTERDSLAQQVQQGAGLADQLQALQQQLEAVQQAGAEATTALQAEKEANSSLRAQVGLLQQQLNAVLGLNPSTPSA
ncbi:hypothetical protein [Pseudomonas oryzihabitans]|uniref:hypothetical protein n=1 Tax=Pseudomonas oryzihabitans TaxID=47885 RepID=UPI000AAAEA2E|nr:hypothetical protein [Pseudomonas psychrotolerans]